MAPLVGPVLDLVPAKLLGKLGVAKNAGYVDLGPGRYINVSGALIDASAAASFRGADLLDVFKPLGPSFASQHTITRGSTYASAPYA